MKNKLKRPELIRVNQENLEVVGINKYGYGLDYNYKGKPFKGFMIEDTYSNGNIESEVEYVEGEPIGWEVEYYENGEIKIETLNYGATSVVFRKFSEKGILINEGWVAPKEYYNKVAEVTGIEKISLE